MTVIDRRIAALPIWAGTIAVEPLHGGLSNESFIVTSAGEKYVVRFGRDFPFHHVSRGREAMTARAAFAAGFAPEVVHAGPGVMVSRFIDGKTCDAGDVKANAGRIADLIGRFHRQMPAHVAGTAYIFWVFHVIRDYARTLREGNSRMVPHLPEFLALSEELEQAQVALPIVFGHHDLLPANFIDDGSRLWLIDFEYAGYGTAMFDLAGISSNAVFSAEEAHDLLARYFGGAPEPALVKAHAAMGCASLLREAMWSMVSELHLDAPGVDYESYTGENLDKLGEALEHYRSAYGRA